MADLYEVLNDAAQKLRPPRIWPKILGVAIVTAILFGVMGFFTSVIYREVYKTKVYHGVYFGEYSMGGMTKAEVVQFLEVINNRLSKEGIPFSIWDYSGPSPKEHKVVLNTIASRESAIELVKLDSEAAANNIMQVGRTSGWRGYFLPMWLRINSPVVVPVPVETAPEISDMLSSLFSEFETKPHNALYGFSNKKNLSNFTVIPEERGKIIDKKQVVSDLVAKLSNLNLDSVDVVLQDFNPSVTAADAEQASQNLPAIFSAGDIQLNFVDPVTGARHDWRIAPSIFADWLDLRKDNTGSVVIGINKEKVLDYLDRNVRPVTDVLPENAKFVMDNGKVKEFMGSKNGVEVDVEKTFQDLDTAFLERGYKGQKVIKTVSVSLTITEPDIKTADVNNLGITDVIGVGVSTFYGSHTNRIKNITTAVKRLNGTLIKPGEVFSANKYAGPYEPENGYYEELVIKGDRIKKEVGGGMCQIGTTLFRMAMNSGMDIKERQNHSLVVSYYSDPVNHNPGTDATLYDPVHDLKFLNDTGNYLLLQTAVDYKKQQLTFTLWGKPDGRKGSYTHPLVSKWIPPGEPKEIPDVEGTVKPGTIECQDAYRGAVASFTYTRVTPSGEKIDRVFDSFYRPLPKICILGEGYSTSTTTNLPLGEPGQ